MHVWRYHEPMSGLIAAAQVGAKRETTVGPGYQESGGHVAQRYVWFATRRQGTSGRRGHVTTRRRRQVGRTCGSECAANRA